MTLVEVGPGRHPAQGPGRRRPPVAHRALAGDLRRASCSRRRGPYAAPPAGACVMPGRRSGAGGRAAGSCWRPGRAAGLPRRLLLLPQPEELGRPQRPARPACCWRWDRWLFLGHSPAVLLHDLLGQHVAAYVLMVVYESFSTLVIVAVRRGRWCSPTADPRRLRLHRLDAVGVDPRRRLLLPDPVAGAVRLRARRVRRAAAHDDPGHPGALPGPARRTCSPTRTPPTPSPRSPPSRACTSPSPP